MLQSITPGAENQKTLRELGEERLILQLSSHELHKLQETISLQENSSNHQSLPAREESLITFMAQQREYFFPILVF